METKRGKLGGIWYGVDYSTTTIDGKWSQGENRTREKEVHTEYIYIRICTKFVLRSLIGKG
jgi:hypothetical protein